MSQSRSTSDASKAIIARLAQPPRMADLEPIAARFVYALRLIAAHDRLARDPVPELATRLGSVECAAKALALAQVVKMTWPEDIHVSRFCCGLLSHDEMTIATALNAASNRDRTKFEATVEGLIRPDRVDRLWDSVLGLVAAEHRAV